MTVATTLGVVLFLAGMVAVLLVAVRRRNVPAIVNALASLGVTLLPLAVDSLGRTAFAWDVTVGPILPLWVGAAGFLHSLGMLGPYDTIQWWDSVTHTLSAALVAALVYAGLIVVAGSSDGVPSSVAVATVAFTFLGGVFWELIELLAREIGDRYDVEPVLVHYSWRDTVTDLVFDVVGALAVVLGDVRAFVRLGEQAPQATETLVVASGAVVAGGSALLAVAVLVNRGTGARPAEDGR
ncbi:hypothetical protein [Halomicrobium urmianum]|uniref:hypothetical protein n=1 Tax=Halomicrobium urmianum TaxID=1586233 RepID=UPI001CD9ABC1|nr:hypothetical protein [Halomicrobium urmianum]